MNPFFIFQKCYLLLCTIKKKTEKVYGFLLGLGSFFQHLVTESHGEASIKAQQRSSRSNVWVNCRIVTKLPLCLAPPSKKEEIIMFLSRLGVKGSEIKPFAALGLHER